MQINFKKLNIKNFCKKNNIKSLGVFGSYARNEQRKDSDIDLLVKFSKRKSLFQIVGMEMELSEKFGKKVELLTEKSISQYLIDRIKKEVVMLYEG